MKIRPQTGERWRLSSLGTLSGILTAHIIGEVVEILEVAGGLANLRWENQRLARHLVSNRFHFDHFDYDWQGHCFEKVQPNDWEDDIELI